MGGRCAWLPNRWATRSAHEPSDWFAKLHCRSRTAQLLERFVNQRDEPAFAALMVRHGPMVLCLCRQMLRNAQEAEDAFQASFLVLAQRGFDSKAAVVECVAVRRRLSCGGRLRGGAQKRRTREAAGVDLSTLPSSTEPANPDLQPVLHEEIRRLPLKYRAPVVLCYLESKTNEEAAHQLAWPVGTVKARLSRARDMLRLRLARRGMGGGLSTRYTASIMPIFLLDSTLRAAMRLATGGGAVKAVAGAVHLAKLKLTTAAVLAAGLLARESPRCRSLRRRLTRPVCEVATIYCIAGAKV